MAPKQKIEPTDNDVLLGKAVPEDHPGTRKVKDYVRKNVVAFYRADQKKGITDPAEKMSKMCHITKILDEVNAPGGRFLKKGKKDMPWEVQGNPRSNISSWFNKEIQRLKKLGVDLDGDDHTGPTGTAPNPPPEPPEEIGDDPLLANIAPPGDLDKPWEEYPGEEKDSALVLCHVSHVGNETIAKSSAADSLMVPDEQNASLPGSEHAPDSLEHFGTDDALLLQALDAIKPQLLEETFSTFKGSAPKARGAYGSLAKSNSARSVPLQSISEQQDATSVMSTSLCSDVHMADDNSISDLPGHQLKTAPMPASDVQSMNDGLSLGTISVSLGSLSLGTGKTHLASIPSNEMSSVASRPPLNATLSNADLSSAFTPLSDDMMSAQDYSRWSDSRGDAQLKSDLDGSTRSARTGRSQYDDVFSDFSSLTFETQSRGVDPRRVKGGKADFAVQRQSSRKLRYDDDVVSVMTNHVRDATKIVERMKNERNDAKMQTLLFGELAEVAWGDVSTDVANAVIANMKYLVGIMQQHWKDPQVQCQACLAFGWLADNNPKIGRAIADQEGIENIVDAMRQHPKNESTQANGCLALGSLAAYNLMNQRKIASLGGIRLILEAMREFLNSTGVQKDACTALSRLARGNQDNMVELAESDGVVAISGAMEVNCENEEIQIVGCTVLSILGSTYRLKELVVQGGGVLAILNGMDYHRGTEKVQANGCSALGQLAFGPHLASIVDANGMNLILKAMRSFEQNETIQLHGCFMLGRICETNSENREAITMAGGVPVVCLTAQKTWTDLSVNIEARNALQFLAMDNGSAQKQIAKNVVGAMKQSPKNSVAQANGCSTLSAIAKNNQESCQWILAAGGIDAVVVAMLHHPYNDEVMASGTEALESLGHNVSGDGQSDDAIDLVLSVFSAMYYNEGKGASQEKSCRLLAQLLFANKQNPKVLETFSEAGGVVTLVASMKRFPANLQIQGNGCASLYILCRENASTRSAVISAGGAKVVVSAIQNWLSQESVVCYGCKILEALASGNSTRREEMSKAGPHIALYNAMAAFPKNQDLVRAAKKALSLLGPGMASSISKPVDAGKELARLAIPAH